MTTVTLLTQVFRSDWCARVAGSPDTWRQDSQSPAACLCTGSGDALTCSEPCGRADCMEQNDQNLINIKKRQEFTTLC